MLRADGSFPITPDFRVSMDCTTKKPPGATRLLRQKAGLPSPSVIANPPHPVSLLTGISISLLLLLLLHLLPFFSLLPSFLLLFLLQLLPLFSLQLSF